MPNFITPQQFNTWIQSEKDLMVELSQSKIRITHYKYTPFNRIVGNCMCLVGAFSCCSPCLVWDCVCCTLNHLCENPFKWGFCLKLMTMVHDEIYRDIYKDTRQRILDSDNILDYLDQIKEFVDTVKKYDHNNLIRIEYISMKIRVAVLEMEKQLPPRQQRME